MLVFVFESGGVSDEIWMRRDVVGRDVWTAG